MRDVVAIVVAVDAVVVEVSAADTIWFVVVVAAAVDDVAQKKQVDSLQLPKTQIPRMMTKHH